MSSASFTRATPTGSMCEHLALLPLKGNSHTRVTPSSRCSEIEPHPTALTLKGRTGFGVWAKQSSGLAQGWKCLQEDGGMACNGNEPFLDGSSQQGEGS